MTIPPRMRQLLRVAGVDRAVGITLIGRMIALVSAPLTLIFQLRYLTGDEQGYYVTFAGIIGLIAFLELGLTQAIAVFAGHEMAELSWSNDGTLSGSAVAHGRLRWLLRLGSVWYAALSAILIVVLLPVGYWYYQTFGKGDVHWRLPWILSVVVGSVNLLMFTPFAIFENAGMIAQVAMLRLQQNVAGNIVSWIVLASGGALLAAPALNAAALLVSAITLWRWRHKLNSIRRGDPRAGTIHFWREIWPLQWRLGLGWLSGYATNFLVPLAVFAVLGSAVAGQFGLSMQLGWALQNLSLAWVTTQLPRFMSFVARQEWSALDSTFFHRMPVTLVVMLAGAAAAWFVIWQMNVYDLRYASRFVAPLPFAILMASTWVVTLQANLTFYIRAHKSEPLYLVILVQGIVLPIATWAVGRQFGVTGVALAVLICAIGVLGFAIAFFQTTRRSHGPATVLLES